MGACTFEVKMTGKNAKDAFSKAREDAAWEYGHNGYTGSIAEKNTFVMINCPEGKDPYDYANELMDNDDPRIADKWGPAGCIKLPSPEGAEYKHYLFFGWASH